MFITGKHEKNYSKIGINKLMKDLFIPTKYI